MSCWYNVTVAVLNLYVAVLGDGQIGSRRPFRLPNERVNLSTVFGGDDNIVEHNYVTESTCDGDDGCLPTLSCQQSGLCRARATQGGACDPLASQCVEDTICDNSGVCVGLLADRPIGAPCQHNGQCESQVCTGGLCVGHCQGN